jgi:dihydroxyacid dehydratase/phosphogluconate dehydratase
MGAVADPAPAARGRVTDMVFIWDARMSGTAFATTVLHVVPGSAVGGPLRVVEDGDPIVLDVDARRLDLDIPAEDLERRLLRFRPPAARYRRGYGAIYVEHVMQADAGCDFDFLRADGERPELESVGLLAGWMAGW